MPAGLRNSRPSLCGRCGCPRILLMTRGARKLLVAGNYLVESATLAGRTPSARLSVLGAVTTSRTHGGRRSGTRTYPRTACETTPEATRGRLADRSRHRSHRGFGSSSPGPWRQVSQVRCTCAMPFLTTSLLRGDVPASGARSAEAWEVVGQLPPPGGPVVRYVVSPFVQFAANSLAV